MYKRFWIVILVSFYVNASAQPLFLGMTQKGGNNNLGTIIKVSYDANNQYVVHDFVYDFPGAMPYTNSFCQTNDGKLYGMTKQGGTYNSGVLFEYEPNSNTYTKKIDFDGTNGSTPEGGLLLATNGKLYGMTFYGGSAPFAYGVLFEFDPNNGTLVKKIDFDFQSGLCPLGSLIQASNGKLYGMTYTGGIGWAGTLFEYDIQTNSLNVKVNFSNDGNGNQPRGDLVETSDGKLFGMLCNGGLNDVGVLFEYNINSNNYVKRFDFKEEDGTYPLGSLIYAKNGNLYGMTKNGGSNNFGVIFEYNPQTNIYTKKVDFDCELNGCMPEGSFIEASNDKLYGMTYSGGLYGSGVIIEYDPNNNICEKKIDFDIINNGGLNHGNLIQAQNGKFYGMSPNGGMGDDGAIAGAIIFEYNPTNNIVAKKIYFNQKLQGAFPKGNLTKTETSKLYGLTNRGGAFDYGVIFEFDTINNNYFKKIDFNGINGKYPSGSFIYANGKLYGTATEGGSSNNGILFEYDPIANTITNLHNFNIENGGFPNGGLLKILDNRLYGMTLIGGTNGYGVIYEYNLNSQNYEVCFEFDNNAGSSPFGDLILSNNKLYGMTSSGGNFDMGVLFNFDPNTKVYSKLHDFNGALTGRQPLGSLMQASNGKFYGLTNKGGINDLGVIFEFDTINNNSLLND